MLSLFACTCPHTDTHTHTQQKYKFKKRGGRCLPPAAGGAIEQPMSRVGDPGGGFWRWSKGGKVGGWGEVKRRWGELFGLLL